MFCDFSSANAQIINFSDANLKEILRSVKTSNKIKKDLTSVFFKIVSNADREIERIKASSVSYVDMHISNLYNISSIQFFDELNFFDCTSNNLSLQCRPSFAFLKC